MNSPISSSENIELMYLSSNNVEDTNNNNTNQITNRLFYKYKYYFEIFLHVFIHLSMLSFLETFFYFYYVTKIEKEAVLEQMKGLSSIDFLYFNNDPFYDIIFQHFQGYYIDDTYNNLYENAESQNNESIKQNNELFIKSIVFSLVLTSSTILYYICYQLYFKERHFIYKVLFKHVVMIFFIGLYEYWLFLNIILKYRFLTKDELTYYIFSCFWVKFKKYYPQINQFQNNTSIDCEFNF